MSPIETGPPPTLLVAPCRDEHGWCVESAERVVARAETRAAAELRAIAAVIGFGGGQIVVRNDDPEEPADGSADSPRRDAPL